MRKGKKILAIAITAVMAVSSVQGGSGGTAQAAAVNKGGYTLSKKAGTYKKTVNVKLKAKKGYFVYYTTNGSFTKSKVIKNGSSKKFTIKKTTTISVYTAKKEKTKTQLQKKAVKKAAVKYVYKIKKNSTENTAAEITDTENNSQSGTQTDESQSGNGTQTGNESQSGSGTQTGNDSQSGNDAQTGNDSQSGNGTQAGNNSQSGSGTQTGNNGQSQSGTQTGNDNQSGNTNQAPDGNGVQNPPSDMQNPGGMGENGSAYSNDTGEPEKAQETGEEAVKAVQESIQAVNASRIETITPAAAETATPVITFSGEDVSVTNPENGSSAVEILKENNMSTVTIKEEGTYVLTGTGKNTMISVNEKISGTVNLILDTLVLDNSELGGVKGQDNAVITIGKSTKNVNVILKGSSSLTGNGSYTKETASAIIYAKDSDAVLTLMASEEDKNASLTVKDAMPDSTNFGENDPTDGICSKGQLVIQSGTYQVSSNGDCLKGSGSKGAGGVMILDGTYELTSALGNGIRSKNGTISVFGGTVKINGTKEDGINAKNYSVNIAGGDITIDQCYGDGIQGEDVLIFGETTKLSITTYFENAGKNYYDTSLGKGNYNTMTKTDTTKYEEISVDTGSHKGIKAGTKACTYQYQSVAEGSELEAGKTYEKKASGGLMIAGGNITINTKNTGIKYNGGMGQGDFSDGSISAANNDGQYIIGAPEDAVHSNNTCFITGGTLTIASADDGISSADNLIIMDESEIHITDAYEGMESGTIIIGSSSENKSPEITIYSNDDGVNASSKATVEYVYADESEEIYTKNQTSAQDNVLYVLDGYLNVMIADDVTHTYSLPKENGETTTGSYSADGDGIDCNGSFYAYGGTIVVYGSETGDNSPVDVDKAYYIGSGVTILAAGSSGMTENPTAVSQAAIIYGSSFGMGNGNMNLGGNMGNDGNLGFGQNGGNTGNLENGQNGGNAGNLENGQNSGNAGNSENGQNVGNTGDSNFGQNAGNIGNSEFGPNMGNPGNLEAGGNNGNVMDKPEGNKQENPGQQTNTSNITAGTAVAVLDSEGNVVTAFKAPKNIGYLLYSSPELKEGSSYTISVGGSVSGTEVKNSDYYDYRYTGYDIKNAETLATVTAEK